MVDVNVDFVLEKDKPVEADFTLNPDVTYTADIKVETSVKEHNKLLNRDLPNQHPVEAITGLSDTLDGLTTGLSDETTARIAEDENLQAQIDEITVEAVTQVIGGSNIEVVREGPRAYVNSKTFVYEQAQASDTWVIVHNLNKYPSVTIVDSAGNVFTPEVQYDNENQITVTMNGATIGNAYLN